jgi:hypothetical protein
MNTPYKTQMALLTLVELKTGHMYQPHRQGIMVKPKRKKGGPRTCPDAEREKKNIPRTQPLAVGGGRANLRSLG